MSGDSIKTFKKAAALEVVICFFFTLSGSSLHLASVPEGGAISTQQVFSLSFNMFQMIVCLLLLVCFIAQHVFVVDSNKLLLFCMFVATGKEVHRNGIKGLFGLFLGATNCDFLLQFRNNNS